MAKQFRLNIISSPYKNELTELLLEMFGKTMLTLTLPDTTQCGGMDVGSLESVAWPSLCPEDFVH